MPKRSITDEEIGLIKAMLARGMVNKDIHLYFNRQDRAVNSGRITGIRNRSYGPEVPKANDEAFSAFIAKFASPALAAPVNVVETAPPAPPEAMGEKMLGLFFIKDANAAWRCTVGETDEFECKEGFSLRNLSKPLRTIAGFANNRGGYLFFGVKDKPLGFAVCRLADDRFTDTDKTSSARPSVPYWNLHQDSASPASNSTP